ALSKLKRGDSQSFLVREIRLRKVDFELTERITSELREAGATPALIEAVRANYRKPAPGPGARPDNTMSATYGTMRFEDEAARLDNFALQLSSVPSAKGFLIAYGGRRGVRNEAEAGAARDKNYLINTRGIEASR